MANETSWIQKYRKVGRNQHLYLMDFHYDDIYKFYTEKYEKKVSFSTYKKLCYEFNERVSDAIIRESFEFKMPYRIGSLRIKANKQKIIVNNGKVDTQKMAIDWGSSHKMWEAEYPNLTRKEIMAIPGKKVLVYTNDHSNGYIMKWYWDRRLSNVKNQSLYMFKPIKGGVVEGNLHYGKRGLSEWIKSDDRTNEYFE